MPASLVLQPDSFIGLVNGLWVVSAAGWKEGGAVFAGPSHQRVAPPHVMVVFRAVRLSDQR